MKYSTICLSLLAVAGLSTSVVAAEAYAPKIDPHAFSTTIDNPFLKLPVGRTIRYIAKSDEGVEKVEVSITGETRTIMGVETLVYLDQSTLNGKVLEVTKDYLAQDKEGNVWYFGEDVDNFENGLFKDHKGTWRAGENGALPGIWVKSKLVPGDSYRQEYLKGKAEDMAKVEATGQVVKTALKSYTDCIKTMEWTPLEKDSAEFKYYCPEAGTVVLTENPKSGERAELIAME